MTTSRPMWIIGALLISTLAAGCGGDPEPSSEDGFAKALAYTRCMRDNGMPDFADPEHNADGGFTMSKDIGKGQEAAMSRAEEACRDLDPASEQKADGGTVDTAALATWTACMRGRIPGLPDPEISGGTITIDLRGTGIEGGEGSDYARARESCGDAGGDSRTISGDAPSPGASR